MLCVRDAATDKVRALDLGAGDYLTKPFDPLELIARLRASRRRGQGVPGSVPVLAVGDVVLDTVSREVRIRGELVRLTATELRLLEALARQASLVLPHRALLNETWSGMCAGDVQSLQVVVRRLRQKLGGNPTQPRCIEGEWVSATASSRPARPSAPDGPVSAGAAWRRPSGRAPPIRPSSAQSTLHLIQRAAPSTPGPHFCCTLSPNCHRFCRYQSPSSARRCRRITPRQRFLDTYLQSPTAGKHAAMATENTCCRRKHRQSAVDALPLLSANMCQASPEEVW